jgi:hypothetical protein
MSYGSYAGIIAIGGVQAAGAIAMCVANVQQMQQYADHVAESIASSPAVKVAVLDSGVVRGGYDHPNLFIVGLQHPKSDNGVIAGEDSERGRGSVALQSMLDEMKLMNLTPVVVYTMDPFMRAADGRGGFNLEALEKAAPVMAKAGVKVAIAPFEIPNDAQGRKLSQIMSSNGIAVFANAPSIGREAAPGIITVKSSLSGYKPLGKAHFTVEDKMDAGLGRIAGQATAYVADSGLSGARQIASRMQEAKEGQYAKVVYTRGRKGRITGEASMKWEIGQKVAPIAELAKAKGKGLPELTKAESKSLNAMLAGTVTPSELKAINGMFAEAEARSKASEAKQPSAATTAVTAKVGYRSMVKGPSRDAGHDVATLRAAQDAGTKGMS